LNKAEKDGLITEVKVCPSAPRISHLLFAGNSLILVRANRENVVQLQGVLQTYESVCGQTINKDKSAIMFSSNTREAWRAEMKSILRIDKETMNDRYLGQPVHVGNGRATTFMYFKERLWQRIQGSKEKMLSKVGKESLIKTVAQAIPTFAMGCFDLTMELCYQMSSIIRRFWWCQKCNVRRSSCCIFGGRKDAESAKERSKGMKWNWHT
jgi:hypothetical protein